MDAIERSTRELDWMALAEEAAETAGEYFDQGKDAWAERWHTITMRRAAIAQAQAMTRAAVALEKIAAAFESKPADSSIHDDGVVDYRDRLP